MSREAAKSAKDRSLRLRARARVDNGGGLELRGARVHLVAGSLDDPGHPSLASWTGALELPGAGRHVDAVATAAPTGRA